MTITNKSLAKQLAKTIKMFDVKLWEVSGAKREVLNQARTKTWEALSALGYQLQSDYTLITNSVNSVIASVDLPQDGDTEVKTVGIFGWTIEYSYEDDFEDEIVQDDPNYDDIKEALCGGYTEGEFCTHDGSDDTDHYGWWKIRK